MGQAGLGLRLVGPSPLAQLRFADAQVATPAGARPTDSEPSAQRQAQPPRRTRIRVMPLAALTTLPLSGCVWYLRGPRPCRALPQ
jgi:hypothetical protein